MSPATRLLQSAQSTARSPFEPEEQTPLLDRSKNLIPNWITSQTHTSAPQSPAAPIPALVPSGSAGSEDLQGHKFTVDAQSRDTDAPIGPIALDSSNTLDFLLHAELTLSKRLATIDPLAPEFMQTLHTLASLRYFITAKRADLAAAQNPKHLNALAKATAIVQRNHHRLAREAAAQEREHNRRQREARQDARYRQRQQDTELKYKRKLELAKMAIEKLDMKNRLATKTRNNQPYKSYNSEPNLHNQPETPTSSPSHSAIASLPTSTLNPTALPALNPTT